MSESLGRAVLELVADLNPLKAQLAEGEVAANEMAASTGRSFKKGITKAALPAAAALGVVVLGMHKAIDAAQEDQVQTARLAQAYKTAGLDFDHYAGSVEDAVTSGAELGFQSADTKNAIGSLIVATHDHAKALADLKIAQDIARFKNISLTAATKMLTMAQAGSTRAVKQLGLTVTPVTAAQDRLKASTKDHTSATYKNALALAKQKDMAATAASVNDLLTQKLHGQADAYAKTAEGAKEKLGAQMELLAENIGRALLPALTAVTGILAEATGWMQKHSTVAKIAIGVVAGLALAILGVNVAMKLYVVGAKLATAAQWLFNAAMDANPIGLVVLAIGLLVAAAYEIYKHWGPISKFFVDLWDGIKSAFWGAVHWIEDKLSAAWRWIETKALEAVAMIVEPFSHLPGFMGQWARDLKTQVQGQLDKLNTDNAQKKIADLKAAGDDLAAKRWQMKIDVQTYGISMAGIDLKNEHPYGVPGHAAGIMNAAVGHWATIGEKGPEMMYVPRGATILPHGAVPHDTPHRAMDIGAGGGPGTTINVYASGIVGNERDVVLKIGREFQKLKARGVDFALA